MILVVGGTGDLGGRVVRLLREQGHAVRCLVRPSTHDAALLAAGAQVVRGDLVRPETLAPACSGVDVVVATATAIGRRLAGGGPSIKDVDERGMLALVEAAEAAGVERFVYMSYPGTAAGTPLDRAKDAVVRRLSASPMRSVVVRSDAFQEIHLGPAARFDVAAGKVSIIGKGDTRRRWISTEDVAALVAGLAVEQDPPSSVTVGGPDAISKNEAVAIVEEVTGRPLKVQRMPLPVARLMCRLLARRNDALASALGAGLAQDATAADWDDAALRARGIKPTGAAEFLRQQARALS